MPSSTPLRRHLWRLVTPVLLLVLCFPAEAPAGTFNQESLSGRTYWLYVPDGAASGTPLPLVLMLHGCTQSGDGFATSTGMNALAEEESFLVAYPEQTSSANSSRCWNWFEPAHQSRGGGEPALLAGMVADVGSSHAVDSDRVYAVGFSAGAAMAVILGATYPDVFAAIGVHSGLEYKAATSLLSAFSVMSGGGPAPDPQGQLAFDAMGSRARVMPVMVIHGTSDFTVATVNGDQVLSQWAQTNDLASDGIDQGDIDDAEELLEGGQVPGGRTYARFVYEDGGGRVVMEKYKVDGMGHNWSGGALGGTFTDPDGPDASRLLVDFFLGADPQDPPPDDPPEPPGGDTTPPSTTAVPAGGTYSSPVDVVLSANEPATTYFTLDGSLPTTASAVYSAPIAIASDTTLRFFSVDGAGNAEAVKDEIYVFASSQGVVLTSIDGEDGYVGQLFADGASTSLHRVGDKGLFNTDSYRLILSFDTSSIPASATITGATLTIHRSSLQGIVSGLTADVATSFFGFGSALVQSDHSAAATQFGAFTLAVPLSDGASSSVALPAGTLSLIPGDRFQVRLRASTPINFASDVLTLHGGGAGALAPTLEVFYQ